MHFASSFLYIYRRTKSESILLCNVWKLRRLAEKKSLIRISKSIECIVMEEYWVMTMVRTRKIDTFLDETIPRKCISFWVAIKYQMDIFCHSYLNGDRFVMIINRMYVLNDDLFFTIFSLIKLMWLACDSHSIVTLYL